MANIITNKMTDVPVGRDYKLVRSDMPDNKSIAQKALTNMMKGRKSPSHIWSKNPYSGVMILMACPNTASLQESLEQI